MIALLVPLVGFGLYPNPMLRRVEPAVLEVLHTMELRRVQRVAALEEKVSSPTAAQAAASSSSSSSDTSPRVAVGPRVEVR